MITLLRFQRTRANLQGQRVTPDDLLPGSTGSRQFEHFDILHFLPNKESAFAVN